MHRARQRANTVTGGAVSRSILIEGWRATNHSLSLVNQHQILELSRLPGMRLFHHDVPYHTEDWKKDVDNSGFSQAERISIAAPTDPAGEKIDCIYRIASPFRAGPATEKRRMVSFIVTELGLFRSSFAPGSEGPTCFTRGDNRVVTPTRWSRDRLVDWGFPADRVSIVPHGVDSNQFRPLTDAQRRTARAILGIEADEIVFLNVGAAVWTKGVDLLLLAFAHLRRGGRKVRLILRDRVDMYGCSIGGDVQKLAAKNPGLFTAETMAAVMVIQDDISREQLRHVYGAVDCYVSPYRAEGFNLPVLEAIACGTPVIVTRGGATDDFCDDEVAVRIDGAPGQRDDAAECHHGRFINPDINQLAEAMDCFATRQDPGLDRSGTARERVVGTFSWRNAAIQLAALTVGYPGAG
jgi:glycosyltransferase involved in cell wall biosynthesis